MSDKTICFTGHRPNKIQAQREWITKHLDMAIERALKKGYTRFISGGALGIDQMAIEIVDLLRDKYNLYLIIAEPFDLEAFSKMWATRDRQSYLKMRTNTNELVNVSPGGYESWKYQARNKWMVDRADTVIAVWDGSKGGTQNTIDYALKQNKFILWIDPKSKKESWLKPTPHPRMGRTGDKAGKAMGSGRGRGK